MQTQTPSQRAFSADNSNCAGSVIFNSATENDFVTNEAFKTLRSNVLFCGKDKKVILVTSTNETEGKSYISSELAKSLSETGNKSILIDADMRKSVAISQENLSQKFLGLSELLSGQADISDTLYHTQYTGFDVIFSGRFPPNPIELLGSPVFDNLLDELKKDYDYIVIDSAPLFHVVDAAVISTRCDGVIFVISSGKTRYADAINAKEQLSKSGCVILGAVLNEVVSQSKYYKKYYKSRYYKSKYYRSSNYKSKNHSHSKD